MQDTGLSVRRRVIKILKGIFATMEEKKMQIDICCKMIALTDDSDPGIKVEQTFAFQASNSISDSNVGSLNQDTDRDDLLR